VVNFAVVPAAGRASRLGRPKALLPFAGSIVLEALIGNLREGGIDRILVVAAAGDDALAQYCRRNDLDLAVNDHPELGMLSSVRCGAESLASALASGGSLVVCPVDFPMIRAATVRTLLLALERSTLTVAVPTFQGRRGHPLLMGAELAARVRDLDPTVGLRALLDRYPCTEVEVADPYVLKDLDTWRDYAELVSAARP
jgi:CTP:molybdopterin cytidylyltransferase MocA